MQITKQRCVVCLKALAAAFGLVLFDQITKLMVVENLKDQSPFVLLDGIFELRYLENRGAAFGIFQGWQFFFIISAVFITAIVVWLFLENSPGAPFSSAADLCCPDFLRRVGELYRPDKSGVCRGLFLFCTHRFPHL